MGYSNSYVNTAMDSFKLFLNASLLNRNVEMTESVFTWLWSIILNSWFIGFALGTLVAVPLTDNFGRKKGLLVGNILTLFAITCMILSIVMEFLILFLIGRFLSASSSGISMCALILFLQVGAVLGMSVLLGQHLLVLVGLALLPSISSILIMLPLHETPKFLLFKNNDSSGAISAIKFYLNTNDELSQRELQTLTEGESNESFRLLQLFKIPHIRWGLILGILCLQLTTPIWMTVYYSTYFLYKANISKELAEYFSSLMLLLSVLATLSGFFIIEKFSRRGLFILASLLNILCLFAFVLFSQLQPFVDILKYGCVVALTVYGITYRFYFFLIIIISFATGPIAWFITAELIPISYRSISQSIALATNHLLAFLLTFICLPLYNQIDAYAIIILFAIPATMCLIVLFKYLPETKGRDIQTIINELRGATSNDFETNELRNTNVFHKDIVSM